MSTHTVALSSLAAQVAQAIEDSLADAIASRLIDNTMYTKEQLKVDFDCQTWRAKQEKHLRQIMPTASIRLRPQYTTPTTPGLGTVIYVDEFKLEYLPGSIVHPGPLWYLINAKTDGIYPWTKSLSGITSQPVFVKTIASAIGPCPLSDFYHDPNNRGQ